MLRCGWNAHILGLLMFLAGDIFIVDEGGFAPITPSHLKASDVDTVSHELLVNLISPPQFGYVENVLPSPGFEKTNTGISIGEQDFLACYYYVIIMLLSCYY